MLPFYFGDRERSLFGVHHAPLGERVRETAVLCCQPIGHEYMRAHRAFRMLAESLARAGFHVLRFDYWGTGDSAGVFQESTYGGWCEDVRVAARELRDLAGVEALDVVGLRLGAVLAARWAAEDRDIRELVLWDPVAGGEGFLTQVDGLEAVQRERFGAGAGRRARGTRSGAEGECLGYVLTPALRAELKGARLLDGLRGRSRTTVVVASSADAAGAGLRAQAAEAGIRLDWREIPDAGDWGDVGRSGGVLFPNKVLAGLLDVLAPEGRGP